MFGSSLGFGEVMMILIIGLIIFGPKKLPEIGRSLGNAIREFRKASNDIVNTFSLDNGYNGNSRRSYSDYTSYTAPSPTYAEQSVSQSDVPADDVNVAPSPPDPYLLGEESSAQPGQTGHPSKVKSAYRRALASRRMATEHRNNRRRV